MVSLSDCPSNMIFNFSCIYQQNKQGKISQTSFTFNEPLSMPLHTHGLGIPSLSRLKTGSNSLVFTLSHQTLQVSETTFNCKCKHKLKKQPRVSCLMGTNLDAASELLEGLSPPSYHQTGPGNRIEGQPEPCSVTSRHGPMRPWHFSPILQGFPLATMPRAGYGSPGPHGSSRRQGDISHLAQVQASKCL